MSTSAYPPAGHPLADFMPVRVATLRAYGMPAVDIFVQYNSDSRPVLYCRPGGRLDPKRFAELEEAGVRNLYVRTTDFSRFSEGLFQSLDAILRDELVPSTERFAALQVAVAAAMEQALRLVDCGRFRDLADQIGEDVVALVAEAQLDPRELFDVARHDSNTFTHLTNVASYCVMLAQRMGIADPASLRRIASAALLHDVGKRFIPSSILARGDRLSPDDQQIVESHPTRGYEELSGRPQLDDGQLMMVYQHHEHLDGSGYPVRVLEHEIHPWARILAVVDVFDSMTARRPHRRSPSPEYVLDYQQKLAGTHFDREVVRCWVSAMSKA